MAHQTEPPASTEVREPLRVVLIEQDEDWRMLAEVRLTLSERFTLIGTCTTLSDGLMTVATQRPDVVLVGLGIPSADEQAHVALLRSVVGDGRLVMASANPAALWTSRNHSEARVGTLDKMCIVVLEHALLEALDELDPTCDSRTVAA